VPCGEKMVAAGSFPIFFFESKRGGFLAAIVAHCMGDQWLQCPGAPLSLLSLEHIFKRSAVLYVCLLYM
jgi:hypothetical protein